MVLLHNGQVILVMPCQRITKYVKELEMNPKRFRS